MTYATIVEAAESASLRSRISACLAQEAALHDVTIPASITWIAERMLTIVASAGWADAWEYARATYTPQYNPDTGARPDVITDQAILSAIQPLVLALKPADTGTA